MEADFVEIVELGPMAKKAEQRPKNYNELPMPIQWQIDESLGILDWDGSSDT